MSLPLALVVRACLSISMAGLILGAAIARVGGPECGDERAILAPPGAVEQFARSVSLSDEVALVGSPQSNFNSGTATAPDPAEAPST